MPNQITWICPDIPAIPSGWPVLIDGQNGTAYEDVSEYLQAVAALEANKIQNTPPNE